VLDGFIRKGYRFKGKASLVTSGKLFEDIKIAYTSGSRGIRQSLLPTSRYVLLQIQEAVPFISPAYTPDINEANMREQWVPYWEQIQTENS